MAEEKPPDPVQGPSEGTTTTTGDPGPQAPSIQKIQELLSTRDDTSRFVGLALLKSVLDNSPELRADGEAVARLWGSISPKFLDRLLRTGSSAPSPDVAGGGGAGGGDNAAEKGRARDMLDLAVAVLHTFAVLLPEQARREKKLVGRIPTLVSSVLHSSETTTQLALQTLLTLVSLPEGAHAFVAQVEDASPLTEIAPSHPLVLEVFSFAWLHCMASSMDGQGQGQGRVQTEILRSKIDGTIQALVASFTGTDAVTLLAFLAHVLRSLDPEVLPPSPKWLVPLTSFIRNLTISRPTTAGRAAYTNLAATLLQVYPLTAPPLLFSNTSPLPPSSSSPPSRSSSADDDKPFPYLLTTLLLIDINSTLPTLLSQLNSPSYPETSARLASALDVLSSFVGYLIRSMDSPPSPGGGGGDVIMTPHLLLKLRKSISETMSLLIEHLRDRYDASVAGAMGLHPDARVGGGGSGAAALTWEAKAEAGRLEADVFVLAAVRALAIWLREDDNDALRREAGGLCDLLIDLYRASSSSSSGAPDFRRPILVALEGITATEEGIEAFLSHDGWAVLSRDMLSILTESPSPPSSSSLSSPSTSRRRRREEELESSSRGLDIVRILLPIVEDESPGQREKWMDVVTAVAAWDAGPSPSSEDPATAAASASPVREEFEVAMLQLVTALLDGAHAGLRRRYAHSTSAVLGIAERLRRRMGRQGRNRAGRISRVEELGSYEGEEEGMLESLDDVVDTLSSLR